MRIYQEQTAALIVKPLQLRGQGRVLFSKTNLFVPKNKILEVN
jgi:hypothetical protein